jgi:hypothetical protein
MIEDLEATAKRILFLWDEWKLIKDAPKSRVGPRVEHWEPPEPAWFKVNVDGSFSPGDGTGGGGVVMRDHHGDFIAGACRFSLLFQSLKEQN